MADEDNKPSKWKQQQAAVKGSGHRSGRFLKMAVLGTAAIYLLMAIVKPTVQAWIPSNRNQTISYHGEHLKWQTCGETNNHPLECSTIDVPIDHFASSQSPLTFSIPLIRLRSPNASSRNLLLNPGGPGGSGVGFLHRHGAHLRTIIGADHHLVSFDPRGVNGSRPQAFCRPDHESWITAFEPVLPNQFPGINVWADGFTRACADTMGEHGKFINTPQTAADMNSILDALGQKDLVFWGFGYGSILGQTYATLFPDRAGRLIFDAVGDVTEWYTSFLHRSRWTDLDATFAGFSKECYLAGEACPLNAGVGSAQASDSPADLEGRIIQDVGSLKDEPIGVYLNNTDWGVVSWPIIWTKAFFPAMSRPATWGDVAYRIQKIKDGDPVPAFEKYSQGAFFTVQPNDVTHFIEFNDAVETAKDRPETSQHLRKAYGSLVQRSWLAHLTASFIPLVIKYKWATPTTHTFVPRDKVRTAHPVLILGSSVDPVYPIASARGARQIFQDSRLVEVKGTGHTSLAYPSSCAARTVRAYLHDGTLPAKDMKCDVDGPYFVAEDADLQMLAKKAVGENGDIELYVAQMMFAREVDWPVA